MMMYDDLVKRLRYCADATTCRHCPWRTECCLHDAMRKAADAIVELIKKRESACWGCKCEKIEQASWIPVTERLPEIGKDVLCFCRANIYFVLGWDGHHWHEGVDRYYMSSFVTHWMPLPEPPKDGET